MQLGMIGLGRMGANMVLRLMRDGHECVRCGDTRYLQIDHDVPITLGGTDDIDNLRALCQSCNASKGARL